MNIPTSYLDPFWSTLAEKAAAKYGVPPGLMTSIIQNGERTDHGKTNSHGTFSPFQITRATRDLVTRQGWADPFASVENAADVATRLVKESLDRNHGNEDQAVGEYQGGTDRNAWGSVNKAYRARVRAGRQGQASADPFAGIDFSQPAPGEQPAAAPAKPGAPKAAGPFAGIDFSQPAPSEKAPPAAPKAPATRVGSAGERFGLGLTDLPLGAAQKLTHAAAAGDEVLTDAANFIRGKFGAAPLPKNSRTPLPTSREVAQSVDDAIDRRGRVVAPGGGVDVARLGGNVVGSLPTLFVPGLNAVKGAGALEATRAAVAGGLALGGAAPVENGQDGVFGRASTNALLGGAGGLLGQAGASLVGRVARPVASAAAAPLQKARATLEAAGVRLTPGQATQNRSLQLVEGALDGIPTTARRQQLARAGQQGQFNRAVLRTIGEDAEAATPEVMAAAKTRIGGEFERLSKGRKIDFDAPLLTDLAHVETTYKVGLTPDHAKIVDNYINDLLGQGQHITGETYQRARSALARRAKSATDPELGNALRGIRDALDAAAERALPPEDIAAWRLARTQYRDMRSIEKAIPPDDQGTISAPLLAQGLRVSDRNAVIYGAGRPLARLATAGKALLPDKVPNSGTAARQLVTQVLTGTVGGGVGGALAGGDLETAAKGALAGAVGFYALPKATQAALNNPLIRGYLINGSPALQKAFGLTPDVVKRLTARAPAAATPTAAR